MQEFTQNSWKFLNVRLSERKKRKLFYFYKLKIKYFKDK